MRKSSMPTNHRVLTGNEHGATWKVACVSVSVSDHKETMKHAVPPAVSYRATRSRVYSCYACSTGHNLMFCHQSPTRACVTGNGGVRSLWENAASSSKMATEA